MVDFWFDAMLVSVKWCPFVALVYLSNLPTTTSICQVLNLQKGRRSLMEGFRFDFSWLLDPDNTCWLDKSWPCFHQPFCDVLEPSMK